jgi:general stress protein 26
MTEDTVPSAQEPGTTDGPTMPRERLIQEFSEPGVDPARWNDVITLLEESQMFWLSTVRADGRPHVAPLPAMWLENRLHFCTGAHEQKARNLEHDAHCVLTTGTNDYRSGVDVVVEGVAQRVVDTDELEQLAAIWEAKIDWRFDVGDAVFLDTTADIHPAIVFAVIPSKVLVFTKAPYSQTRFDLAVDAG